MIRNLLLALLLLLPLTCWAEPADLAAVINSLEISFSRQTPVRQRITDFQGEFFQQSHIASISRVQHGEGRVRFKFLFQQQQTPTVMFRWEYSEPEIQEIISDGQTLWFYLPDNSQVIQSDMSDVNKDGGPNPVTFLSSLGDLGREFSVTWGEPRLDERGNYRLRLTPLVASNLVKVMEVVVAKDAVEKHQQTSGKPIFPLLQTDVTDQQGNRTTIEFVNVKVNPGLPTSDFKFAIPPGVEVVKPTEQQTF